MHQFFRIYHFIILSIFLIGPLHSALLLDRSIKIDFGEIAPGAGNYNQVEGNGMFINLINDLGDDSMVDLFVSTPAGGDSTPSTLFLQDTSGSGGSTDPDIYDDGIINAGRGDDQITLTFSGLDTTLTYNIFAGGQTPGNDFGANWTITTGSPSTVINNPEQNVNPFVNFLNIAPDSSGVIALNINDISNGRGLNRNIGLAELTLTAVPEPSVLTVLTLMLTVIFLFYRRKRFVF